MKKGLLLCLFTSGLVLSGCGFEIETPDTKQLEQIANSGLQYAKESANTFIENNEYAQQAKELANQAYDQAQEKANKLVDQAKSEAQAQYHQLKEDIKSDLKNRVNDKIDQTFENF